MQCYIQTTQANIITFLLFPTCTPLDKNPANRVGGIKHKEYCGHHNLHIKIAVTMNYV